MRLEAWDWGPVSSTYGGSRTAFHCVPKSVPQNIRLCGPGTLLGTFWGHGVPRVPPYFNHDLRLRTPTAKTKGGQKISNVLQQL